MPAPSGHVSAAAYGRMINVGPSGISRMIARGLPYVDGTDDHNRYCKFIDPAAADAWRAVNLTPKIDGNTGAMRGAVEPQSSDPSPEQPPQPVGSEPPAPDAPPPTSGAGIPHKPQRPSPKPPPAAKTAGGGELTAKALAEQIATQTQQMRLQKIQDETATARLRRLAAEGKLIDRDLVLEGVEFFAGMVVRLLERVPADNASTLAAKVGGDEHKVYLALQQMTDDLRSNLASICARERDRVGEREVELPEPGFD